MEPSDKPQPDQNPQILPQPGEPEKPEQPDIRRPNFPVPDPNPTPGQPRPTPAPDEPSEPEKPDPGIVPMIQ